MVNHDQDNVPEGKGVGRRWRLGEDSGSWSLLKVAHARSRFLEIDSRINLWNASGALKQESILSEDRRRLEIFLRINSRPPVHEWSLILGDVLYALRSALDATVWEYAHTDGACPERPDLVQFPVVRKRRDWARARERNLQTVPEVIAERIEMVQPFQAGELADQQPLAILSSLNNFDKHRASIGLSVGPGAVTQNVSFEFEEESNASAPKATYDLGSIADGAVIGLFEFSSPVQRASGRIDFNHVASVETKAGTIHLPVLLGRLIDEVSMCLNFFAMGPPTREEEAREHSRKLSDEPWIPMQFKEDSEGKMAFDPAS
ncbi:hypothetical protein [Streptomyces sp. NPDC056049]|uniref:hypothetical protein n=1 Tax=Streptomyces sp. NPDC056049 TaxID=3345693 RepID=UPI0035D7BAF9